jgi:hypothetical protein
MDPEKQAKLDLLLQDQRVVASMSSDHTPTEMLRGMAQRFLDSSAGNVPVAAGKLAKHLLWRVEYNMQVCMRVLCDDCPHSARHSGCFLLFWFSSPDVAV